MNKTITLVSTRHCAARQGFAVRPASASRRYTLSSVRQLISVWRARRRFRWDLEQIAQNNPHLIDDIGLRRWQIEAEIAKRFWEA